MLLKLQPLAFFSESVCCVYLSEVFSVLNVSERGQETTSSIHQSAVFNPPGFLQCTCLNVKLWTYYTWGSKFNNNKTWWLPASKLLPLVSANKINCYCSKHQLLNLFFHQQFTLLIPFDKPIFVFVSSICTIPSIIHSLLLLGNPHCF